MQEQDFRKGFGRAVKTARESLRLTQRSLAESAGIAEKYLSRIELGMVTPSVLVAFRLARELDITVDALIGSKRVEPPEVVIARRLLRDATPVQRDLALRVLRECLR